MFFNESHDFGRTVVFVFVRSSKTKGRFKNFLLDETARNAFPGMYFLFCYGKITYF